MRDSRRTRFASSRCPLASVGSRVCGPRPPVERIGDSKHFWSIQSPPRFSQGPAAGAPPARCGSSVTSSRAPPCPNAVSHPAPRAHQRASRPSSPAAPRPHTATAAPAPTVAAHPRCEPSLAPMGPPAAPSALHTEGTANLLPRIPATATMPTSGTASSPAAAPPTARPSPARPPPRAPPAPPPDANSNGPPTHRGTAAGAPVAAEPATPTSQPIPRP